MTVDLMLMLVLVLIISTCTLVINGVTDQNDVTSLKGLFQSMNSPSQLNWPPNGNDPCGQSWKGITCSGNRVTEIKLPGLGLSGSLHYQLQSLTAVTNLDLSANNLGGTIPYNLPPNLQHLNLANNNLTGKIPYSLSDMTSLIDLNLGHNQLQQGLIVDFQKHTSLSTLDLSFNSLTGDLPQTLNSLSSITTMYLQNNQFTGTIDVLANLPLDNLNVENNNFTGWIPEQLKTINLQKDGNAWSSGPAPSPPPGRSHKSGGHGTSSDAGKSDGGKKSGIGGGGIAGIMISILVVGAIVAFFLVKRRSKKSFSDVEKLDSQPLAPLRSKEVHGSRPRNLIIGEQKQMKLDELPLFDFEKLETATNNFHLGNMLGKGGFGPVYKGILEDGQEIAVKRLSKASGQGVEEFMNEVVVISKLQHRNLVRLLGCCIERDEQMLVYELMPNKSLDAFLFDPLQKKVLDWRKRFNIIEGIARGILYLHRDSRLRIIHRDLKASNILLDGEMTPKISDFGLARIFKGGEDDEANTKRVVGTYGYMPPEYAMEGLFSDKSDVYSFGVLLLEIVSGRRNTSFYNNNQSLSLVGFAWKLWLEENIISLIDPEIWDPCFESSMLRCIHMGLLCVQEIPRERPTISTVVLMLISEITHLPPPGKVAFVHKQNATSAESFHKSQSNSNNNVTLSEVQGR